MVIPAVITLMPHMSALLDNIKNQYFKQVEREPASFSSGGSQRLSEIDNSLRKLQVFNPQPTFV